MKNRFVAVRDRDGKLSLFVVKDPGDIIKNGGAGHWIPKFNSMSKQIDLDPDDFPEIHWDDVSPTTLKLVNTETSEENVENISLSGTIELPTKSSFSQDNLNVGFMRTLFVNDISSIEPTGPNECILHMKNGDIIECKRGERAVKHLIASVLS